MDFLNYLPDEVKEDILLVSFDVVSLYTSIPHDLGLTAIEYWIDNYTTILPRPFSKEFILEAISLVLKENTFSFDNKHYRQLQGTAIGTKMAPSYATLVMGYLEANLYGVPQGSNLGPILFLLYINDLPNCLETTKANLFADDTNLTCGGFSPCEIEIKLNNKDIENLHRWLTANKLSLNMKKTEFMIIGSRHHLTTIENSPCSINIRKKQR